jgi:hypothetical protein
VRENETVAAVRRAVPAVPPPLAFLLFRPAKAKNIGQRGFETQGNVAENVHRTVFEGSRKRTPQTSHRADLESTGRFARKRVFGCCFA